jgi:hypothetical protein
MRKAGYTVLAFDGDELVGELTPCGILPVVVDDDFTTPVVLTLEADRMRHEV